VILLLVVVVVVVVVVLWTGAGLLSLIPARRRSRRRRGGEEPGRHWRFSRAAEEREKKEDKWALPELPHIDNCFVSAYLELNQIM
jgi:hypothetical protein